MDVIESYFNGVNARQIAKDMGLKDRLLGSVNIYTSLTQKKSYRLAYSKSEAIDILKDMAKNKKVDISIVNDINDILVKD